MVINVTFSMDRIKAAYAHPSGSLSFLLHSNILSKRVGISLVLNKIYIFFFYCGCIYVSI